MVFAFVADHENPASLDRRGETVPAPDRQPPAAGSEYRVGGTLLEQPGGGQGELAQHSGCVFLVPDLGELAVVRAEDLLPGHRDRPARRREPEQVEYAGVGVGHGPPAGHEVISSGSNSPDRSGRP